MNLWFDLKYAWRLLLKTPGHSLLSAAVIALSVGLALWAYACAHSVAFKSLGIPGSENWYSVQIAPYAKAPAQPSVDAYTYQEITKRTRTVNYLGAFSSLAAVLSEGEASTRLRAAAISPHLLAVTNVRPHLGRLFDETDSQIGATPAVILSFDTWQNNFASDPAIIGKQIRIDMRPVQVIGVMPRNFDVFQNLQTFEIWMPLQLPVLSKPSESNLILSPFVIVENNQNLNAASSEIKSAVDEVNKNYPSLFRMGRHVELIVARHWAYHQALQMIAMINLIGLAVLLIGCVNVSMVFLARFLERSRELALRTALGSSRGRILRQCLLETSLVVLLGLLAGYGLAALAFRWSSSLYTFGFQILGQGLPSQMPGLQPSDVGAAVIIAIAVWLLSTLIPAWRVAKQDAVVALAGSGKGAVGPGAGRSLSVLVGVQVLVSSLVLVLCANIVFAVREEANRPSGLIANGVMISTFPTIFDARYSATSERLRYWDELTAKIKGTVKDASVAYASAAPATPPSTPVSIENEEGAVNKGVLRLPLTVVSENYFELLGIKLRSGRIFDSNDNNDSLGVAIVDEIIAKRYWPGRDAIGKRIQLARTESQPWLTIVGVVSSVTRPYERDVGVIYRPMRQVVPTAFQLLVKLPSIGADSRVALRAAAFAVDRDLPLNNLQLLDDFLDAVNLAYSKMMIPVFSAIAILTGMLAASGLYGLISRSVVGRTQEVGVRRALGATQWQCTAIFLRQAIIYLMVGIVGGCLGTLITNVLSASMFYNILEHAVLVTSGVFVLMSLVVLVSSYLPTRGPVALEPGDALRYE